MKSPGDLPEEATMKNFNDNFLNKIMRYVLLTFLIMLIMVWAYRHMDTILWQAGTFIGWITGILKPLVFGIMVALLLSPVVHRLERGFSHVPILRKHRTRGLSVAITVLAALLVFFLVASLLLSSLTNSLQAVSVENLKIIANNFQESISGIWSLVTEVMDRFHIDRSFLQEAVNNASNWARNSATSAAKGVTGFMTTAFFSLIFSIYFMADHEGFIAYWTKAAKSILPEREYGYFMEFLGNAGHAFIGYVRGQLLDAVFVGVTMSIILSLIEVPYALLIGMMMGIGNLIPYVGPAVGYVSVTFVCVFAQDHSKLLIALIAVFVITTIDGNVINPRILSNAVSVHPVLVIAALLVGSAVGGVTGMFLAVPVASLIRIYFDKLVDWRCEETDEKLGKKIDRATDGEKETRE